MSKMNFKIYNVLNIYHTVITLSNGLAGLEFNSLGNNIKMSSQSVYQNTFLRKT